MRKCNCALSLFRLAPERSAPSRNAPKRPWYAAISTTGRVAELADAQASGACVRKDVGVQVPPRPLASRDGQNRLRGTFRRAEFRRRSGHSGCDAGADGWPSRRADASRSVASTRCWVDTAHIGCWWIGCGPGESRRKTPRSTNGRRRSRRAMACAGGTGTTWSGFPSSRADTGWSCGKLRPLGRSGTSWTWRVVAGSSWSLQLAICSTPAPGSSPSPCRDGSGGDRQAGTSMTHARLDLSTSRASGRRPRAVHTLPGRPPGVS